MKTTNVSSRRSKSNPMTIKISKDCEKLRLLCVNGSSKICNSISSALKPVKKYLEELLRLTAHYWKSPVDLSDDDLRCYFNCLQNGCRYSTSSMGIIHAALTFFIISLAGVTCRSLKFTGIGRLQEFHWYCLNSKFSMH